MFRLSFIFLFIFILSFCFSQLSFAETNSYVLPYPSSMPGSKVYIVHKLFEKLEKYYYFGDFAQFRYNLQQSDKYLVQARTLFEYNQYLLGYQALQESNSYFAQVYPSLQNAQEHRKNISEKETIFNYAKQVHVSVLEKMKQEVPQSFTWQDEKKPGVTLSLGKLLDDSIALRR